MVEFEVPEIDYTDYSNRQLAAVPLAVLAVALLIIGGWYVATGYPVNPGLEFIGGTELRIDVEDGDARAQIDEAFAAEPDSVRQVASDGSYIITFRAGDASTSELESQANDAGFEVRAIDSVSPSFGSDTQFLALGGLLVAFTGMSVLVFAMFRTFVPSVAVVASAFSDVMVPLAMMNLLGIELTLGTVAALLMLIGYSVDSDILLNNSILRRTGDFYESTNWAMRTGVTMTVTSIAAMTVMTIAAWIFGIGLLTAIGIILVIGLLTDLMNTYLLNVSLLRWYKYEGVKR
ncbi:protein translocase subunit SecF [Natronocalculus amylovorans]|uniref:Protein-export membrane protein SecF n=1 Tax=Natronocalculus amylovorans TaxID=2917812 RepID=A0AAE3FW76_9EURY|nr:protein translocase subunit SecF [Natronocalculus amylovorans]MCL9816727.1 protein translocase subunit SecF [Natronocalculus amylovorans]